ncbi:GNAT family N-acetyltransferase [Alloiococcus sp. CFN-8]|uniref:GNAT family N-acetyltransferase n=1 Tax=Alloiococcus sp. CFN-8 TaxID=3416081 RepID=UPI003CE9CE29
MILEQLSSSNKRIFEKLLLKARDFNQLNEDFYKFYNCLDWIKLLRLKKKVFLIKVDSEYIGYIWTEETDYKVNKIYSLYINGNSNITDLIDLSKYFRRGHKFYYECRLNSFNKQVLDSLSFKGINHYIEMKYSLEAHICDYKRVQDIAFRPFIEDKDEILRCKLQNDIFFSEGRVPLNIKDMYNDEEQEYYLMGGGFFITHKGEYVGYGQLIKHDYDDSVLLVNFGILEAKRNNGLGRLLLNYILNQAKVMGYKYIYLRVNINNIAAIKLYSDFNFRTCSNIMHYEYEIK